MILPDQEDRDSFLDYHGHSIISAGAGTGKSTILAKKILRLLLEQKIENIHQIVAITFTKKAAAELKWKIASELEASLDEIHPKFKRTINDALRDLQAAQIGTIHSFCSFLIQEYGSLLSITTEFKILSEDFHRILFHDEFERYCLTFWKNNSDIARYWQSIFTFDLNINVEKIKSILLSNIDKNYLLLNLDESDFIIHDEIELYDFEKLAFTKLKNIFEEYSKKYDTERELKDKLEKASFARIIIIADKILNKSENFEDLLKYVDQIPSLGNLGSKKYVISENVEDLDVLKSCIHILTGNSEKSISYIEKNQCLKFFQIEQTNISITHLLLFRNEYLRYSWYRVMNHFYPWLQHRKFATQSISYQDLILISIQLLKNPKVLYKLQNQFHYFFIDEAQDTDPLQTSIFKLLSNLNDISNQSQNKLIRVGDEKQSIYRFRGSELDTFRNEKDEFKTKNFGRIFTLTSNLRSNDKIINFVNLFFKQYSHTQTNSMTIANYESLHAIHSTQGKCGVYLNLFQLNTKVKPLEWRQYEADAIAQNIIKIKQTENSATIAILFRSLTDIATYQKALEKQGLTYDTIGRTFYGENNLLVIIQFVLSLLLDPFKHTALLGLMRSPLFNLNDIEIQEVSDQFDTISLGEFQTLETNSYSEIKNLSNILFDIRKYSQNNSLFETLHFIIHRLTLLEASKLFDEQDTFEESVSRLLEFCNQYGFNFKSKSTYDQIEKLQFELNTFFGMKEEFDSNDSDNTSRGRNIQLLSFHKCKGLEFDYVFFADLKRNPRKSNSLLLLDQSYDKGHTTLFHYKNDIASQFKNPVPVIERKEFEELSRLIYVGMTRAKQNLFLTLETEFPQGIEKSILHTLVENTNFKIKYEQCQDEWHCVDIRSIHNQNSVTDIYLKINSNIDTSILAKNQIKITKSTFLPNIKDDSPWVKTIPYSGTLLMNQQENEPPRIQSKNISKSYLSGTVRGLFTHKIFEIIDLANPTWSDTIAKKTIEMVPEVNSIEYTELYDFGKDLISTYKKSEMLQYIQTSKIIGRELPFSHFEIIDSNTKLLGTGFIDLVIHSPLIGLLIIDFKSNEKPNHTPLETFMNDLKRKYLPQMHTYQKVIQDAFPNETTVKLSLYHSPSGKLVFY